MVHSRRGMNSDIRGQELPRQSVAASFVQPVAASDRIGEVARTHPIKPHILSAPALDLSSAQRRLHTSGQRHFVSIERQCNQRVVTNQAGKLHYADRSQQ